MPEEANGSQILTDNGDFNLTSPTKSDSLNSDDASTYGRCVVCKEQDAKKLFTCLHAICSKCLPIVQQSDKLFKCVQCNECHLECVDNVMILLSKGSNPNATIPSSTVTINNCDWCLESGDQTLATSRCAECQHYLCKECLKGHNRNPVFRLHTIASCAVSVEESEDNDVDIILHCVNHPKETLQLFCERCDMLTCRECQLTQHNGHTHRWVGEKVTEVQTDICALKAKFDTKSEEITGFISHIEDNIKLLKKNEVQVHDALTQCTEEMIKNIKEWSANLQLCLQNEAKFRADKLHEVHDSYRTIKKKMQHCSSFVSAMLSQCNAASIIQVSGLVKTRLESLTQQESGNKVSWIDACTRIRFERGKDAASIVRNIGRLIMTPFDVDDDDIVTVNGLDSCGKLENEQTQVSSSTTAVLTNHHPKHNASNNGINDNKNNEELTVTASVPLLISANDNNTDDDAHMDYCCVCYDGGELVCCSYCDYVYHSKCHLPVLQQIPKDYWVCSLCCGGRKIIVDAEERKKSAALGRMTKLEKMAACHVLLSLFDDPASVEFSYPVDFEVCDAKGTPYHDIIKNPMDLTTIREKLEANSYTDVGMVISDIQLIFDNCYKFNVGTDRISQTVCEKGRHMESKFLALVSKVFTYTTFNGFNATSTADFQNSKRRKLNP